MSGSSGTLLVDVVVVLAMIAYAITGYRRGFFVGVLSLAGFIAGAFVAAAVVPGLVRGVTPALQRVVIVGLSVLGSAIVGQVLGSMIGSAVRDRVTFQPARAVDRMLGAVAGTIAVAIVLWFIGGALRASPVPSLSRAVSGSRVLGAVDALMPGQVRSLASDLRAAVAGSDLPRVFSGVAEEITPVGAPAAVVLGRAQLTKAQQSIVKIVGDAADCGRGQEGSGAVVAHDRVVTNAHVVAGVARPYVQVAGVGRRYSSSVVAFDPRRDVAVLAVPGLPAPPLARGGRPLSRGDNAVVVGFPRNGRYTPTPARVRQVLDARGEDIYGGPGVDREIYSLRSDVQPGNSGGPLLNAKGVMTGLVFARSADDAHTGYALTLQEITPVIDEGIRGAEAVVNAGCAVG